MSKNALLAPQALKELTEKNIPLDRLDIVYDHLRLIGAVVGLKKLLEAALTAPRHADRISASKELVKLDENPEAVVERLRAAPFVDLQIEELEAILKTGTLDPEDAMRELEDGDAPVDG